MTEKTRPPENRALRAPEAGKFLADLLGLDIAISAQQMWRYGRLRILPTIHLGRSVLFKADALVAFVEKGGAAFTAGGDLD